LDTKIISALAILAGIGGMMLPGPLISNVSQEDN
jgi:hypothetical protein